MILSPGALFLRRLADTVRTCRAAALVTVAEARGSAPREAGAMMVVLPDGSFFGTIGGGALEWEAQALAREALQDALSRGQGAARRIDRALGPDLGQCCGGRVLLDLETFTAADRPEIERRLALAAGDDPRQPVLMFGAGHVGRALALALAPLPFRLRWVETREAAFPAHLPANAEAVASRDPAAEAARAEAGSFALILTHDHALDLAITAAALRREDLPFVGLIGSATKRARFDKRLRELGIAGPRIAGLVCPIGLPGVPGKEPAVIAASVAAQLLGEMATAPRNHPGFELETVRHGVARSRPAPAGRE